MKLLPDVSHVITDCYINAKCVGYGDPHMSQKCNDKSASVEVRKPPPKLANCGLVHPYNHKGCSKISNHTLISL